MKNSDGSNETEKKKENSPSSPVKVIAPSSTNAEIDTENPSSTAAVSSIIRRWEREDLLNKCGLVLRAAGFIFSSLSFVVMASNQHGYGRNFKDYEEYRYCLGISILALIYTGGQISRQIHRFSTGKELISRRNSLFLDFAGDQGMSYLLISSFSSAASLTNRLREGNDNLFTDSAAASISMEFFAFSVLSVSSLISGFKLSNQTYI